MWNNAVLVLRQPGTEVKSFQSGSFRSLMDTILVKIFVTAFALSQVMTHPEGVRPA